jgi:hypothetical protein
MSRWLATFREKYAEANRSNRSDSPPQEANGPNGPIGPRIEGESEKVNRILAAAAAAVAPELADDPAELCLRGETP